MSTAQRRGAQCQAHAEKKQYRSRSAAERALSHIRKFGERRENGKPCRVYSCTTCGRFFLTSKPN